MSGLSQTDSSELFGKLNSIESKVESILRCHNAGMNNCRKVLVGFKYGNGQTHETTEFVYLPKATSLIGIQRAIEETWGCVHSLRVIEEEEEE